MKITAKTTKAMLKEAINVNYKGVKDKALKDQIDYTAKAFKKDEKSVTRADLVDLVKQIMTALGDKFVEPAFAEEVKSTETAQPQAENSVKKLPKGASKKQEVAKTAEPEEVSESEETAEEQVDEKSAKKSLGKKSSKKSKEGVTNLAEKSDKAVQLAENFPEELTVGDTTYKLAHDIKTMEDLHTALENDEEIVFAYYWTKRHLKQFPYYVGSELANPKSFDNDLDLATAIYVSDEGKVSYQISMYTEAVYSINPSAMEEDNGVRISTGMEYQIYRAV